MIPTTTLAAATAATSTGTASPLAAALGPVLATPLFWISITLLVYLLLDRVAMRFNRHPVASPILYAPIPLAGLMLLTGTSYSAYIAALGPMTFLIGPATVALAVPLWRNWPLVRRSALPLVAALAAGSVTAILSALALALAFGFPPRLIASVAAHAVTTPVAMVMTDQLQGIISLAIITVLISGLVGSVIATPLLNRMGITDQRARGFAVGTASHALGTARAFHVSETAGTFSGMAMALNAVTTAVLISLYLLLA